MIAKRIGRHKGGSDFARLARYVVDARGGIDPAGWKRTADYILDTARDGAKVSGVRISNCAADDPAAATLEIAATQGLNTRSKADKTYHLVVSFPAGEQPSRDQLNYIEDELVAAIGLKDHQRISAIHTDTDNLHVHIAINKVHPETRRCIEPYYDKRWLMQTCDRLEAELGLQRTNHGAQKQRTPSKSKQKEPKHERPGSQQRRTERERGAAAALRKSYLEAIADRPKAATLNDMRVLSRLRVDVLADRPEVLLPGDAHDQLVEGRAGGDESLRRRGDGARAARASSNGSHERRQVKPPKAPPLIGDAADETKAEPRTWRQLGDKLRDFAQRATSWRVTAGLPGGAERMEAHSGQESLLGWIKNNAKPRLLAARNWKQLHVALAEYGLRAKLRGNGLVFVDASGIHIKASQVDRSLSLDKLKRAWGDFKASEDQSAHAGRRAEYQRGPKQPHPASAHLYAEFQRVQAAARTATAAARSQLREAHALYAKELADWYDGERKRIKSDKRLRGRAKLDALKQLTAKKRADYSARRELERQQAKGLVGNTVPTWQQFLEQRAAAGDGAAKDVLRTRARGDRPPGADDLRSEPRRGAKPEAEVREPGGRARKSGNIVFRSEDGGIVVDAAEAIRVENSTRGAAVLALKVAMQRYEGTRLVLDGSTQFKETVAKVAGEQGLAVQFADAGLEQIRKASTPTTPPTQRGEDLHKSSLDSYVDQRNALREKLTDIAPHRRWTEADAGPAVYNGRRRFEDGAEAVLLHRDGEMLVMPVTSAQAAKASNWKRGQSVNVDPRGRFLGPESGKTR